MEAISDMWDRLSVVARRFNELLGWCREQGPRLRWPPLFAETFDFPRPDGPQGGAVEEQAQASPAEPLQLLPEVLPMHSIPPLLPMPRQPNPDLEQNDDVLFYDDEMN